MKVYFSAKTNSFIPAYWKDDGTYDEYSWPDDAVLLDDSESETYWKVSPPVGKQLGSTADGRPCWEDLPPPSHDELVSQAESHKEQLAQSAEQSIRPLERAKQLGIATSEELSSLSDWERYSVFLMRVDTSLAPNIEWPQKPQ